jgi:hypothetical protein
MAFVKNVSNPNIEVNLDTVATIVKRGDTSIVFKTAGGAVEWTFSTLAKRNTAFTNLLTQFASVAIAE